MCQAIKRVKYKYFNTRLEFHLVQTNVQISTVYFGNSNKIVTTIDIRDIKYA